MRILILGSHHRASLRGANVAIRGLAVALRDRGHAVTLVQAAHPEHRAPLPGLRHEYTTSIRKSVYPLRFALRRLGTYDVVHSHDQSGAGLALRSRFERLPWVAQFQPPTVHDESFWDAGWRWRYIGLAARHAPLLLSPSRWLADALARRYAREPACFRVVPYGIGAHWFDRPEPPPHPGPPRIVLVNMKGVDVGLRAFAKVLRDHPARLELFGEHKQSEAYRVLARELGIAEHVTFHGFVPNVELPERLVGADLLLHPARSESFGQVLAEAAALGIPAVTSRVNAVPEVVLDGETGLLCPVDDEGAFAAALETLLAQPDRRRTLGRAARERAEREWRWEAVARRLEDEVYAPLVERRGHVTPSDPGARAA